MKIGIEQTFEKNEEIRKKWKLEIYPIHNISFRKSSCSSIKFCRGSRKKSKKSPKKKRGRTKVRKKEKRGELGEFEFILYTI